MEETQLANGFENSRIPKKEEDIECEMEQGERRQSRASGSWRTRSQVAPDWTVQEAMILVNEISAIEGDCQKSLSSYQKWKIIVENCNALDVPRSLNQCRRKWDSLLSEYKKIKKWESESKPRSYWSLDSGRRREFGLSEHFDAELFKVVDDHVKAQEDRSDTEPDSDPDAKGDLVEDLRLKVMAESVGSKKQRRRAMRQRRSIEKRVKPQKRSIDDKIKLEQSSIDEKIKLEQSSIEEKVKPLKRSMDKKIMPEQSSREEKVKPPKRSMDEKIMLENSSIKDKEQMMATELRENVELINAILKGNLTENEDFVLADLKNVEASQTDITRRQGDKLIACLGNLADTLDQLCDLVQECG